MACVNGVTEDQRMEGGALRQLDANPEKFRARSVGLERMV